MKKTVKLSALLMAAAMLLALLGGCGQNTMPEEVLDHVFDMGTYTRLDYKAAEKFFAEHNDNWGGGCSAVATVTDAGETLVGRNMDLNISRKAAYVFRTSCKGCYDTVGLAYTFRDYSPDYEMVKLYGVDKDFADLRPFIADDVLNSEGLYIEVNMRYGECWPTGDAKFSCAGTNPDSDERVYMFELCRYIGEHCATVDEALEYVKTLNIYSQDGYWNYCFILADATGHYGLLEFGMDEIFWTDYQHAQANFYVNEELAELQTLKCGVGRYELLMNGIDAVQSEEDMYDLIRQVSYSQVYDPSTCPFDTLSENVGAYPFATYDFVTDPEVSDFVIELEQLKGDYVRNLSREEKEFANEFWESTFTEVINCNERTLFVRFFEDESRTLTLGFDEK